ncbi:MAG: TetR/AcrR family transcriptional regulator [Methanoregula sp.]|nr:TetR/AcrR family transcriptional regulator [Methanoregula sp.]MDD5024947.1 TetR/AcrR family transcriptional regulator [Methanoregula sp.]MDD5189373.1 TetR/AcrR family transcriptional regulator [Methanoregula sp.]
MPRINTEYREDAKKKIIAAALAVAAEKGWDAVTLEAIAQKVGVTKGALYAYFENREALRQEVILEVFRNIHTGIETTLENTGDIHSMIRNLADLVFEQQKPYATIFYQLPMRLPQDPLCREEFARIFDNNRILIRDCLARKNAEGKLSRDVDPETASSTIIALTLGLRISSLFLGKDADTAKKIWIDSVERILLIGPGAGGR